MGVDLALDGVDVLNRSEVQMLAPDEWFHRFQEARAGRGIAGTLARFDPGGAFPILSHALVVELGGLSGDGDLGGPGIGPQAEIDSKDVAVDGGLGEKLDESLDQIDRGSALIVFERERE